MADKRTVGVALIELLHRYGVEHVFGIPGVHTIELYRGLAASPITHHTPRHEQGAGFMADGYARISGKPGVCFVITGPGLTNIATPMGQALADSIPMLVISSVNNTLQTPQARGMLHEMPNQLTLSNTLTRFSQTIHCEDELAPTVARAFDVFSSARPGPVHLQIPVSLLGAKFERSDLLSAATHSKPPAPDTSELTRAAQVINQSKTPALLIGGGCRHASTVITELIEKIDAPSFLTINARGVLSRNHPLAISVSGTMKAARSAIAMSDLVIAIGTELSATDYDQFKDGGFIIPGTLLRCDIDPMQINNNFQADIGIISDAGHFARNLLPLLQSIDRNGAGRCNGIREAAEKELTNDMRKHLSLFNKIYERFPDVIFCGDSTQLIYSANMVFNTDHPNRWFNSSVGFGTLGYALPAAIGASIANPASPIVCIIGDGGLQFVLGELGTLKDSTASIAVLVWCNQGYREIKSSMEQANVTTVGVEFTVPNYVKVAEAYGIDAVAVQSEAALFPRLEAAFNSQKPIIIEIDENEFMQRIEE